MEYKAIEPGIRLNYEMGCYDTREEQGRRDQHQEAAEPESHGDTANLQSEADLTSQGKADSVMSRGYKGEEVNLEVQYTWQEDPAKLSNNLEQNVKTT